MEYFTTNKGLIKKFEEKRKTLKWQIISVALGIIAIMYNSDYGVSFLVDDEKSGNSKRCNPILVEENCSNGAGTF